MNFPVPRAPLWAPFSPLSAPSPWEIDPTPGLGNSISVPAFSKDQRTPVQDNPFHFWMVPVLLWTLKTQYKYCPCLLNCTLELNNSAYHKKILENVKTRIHAQFEKEVGANVIIQKKKSLNSVTRKEIK